MQGEVTAGQESPMEKNDDPMAIREWRRVYERNLERCCRVYLESFLCAQ
jgi:hypothetical protein